MLFKMVDFSRNLRKSLKNLLYNGRMSSERYPSIQEYRFSGQDRTPPFVIYSQSIDAAPNTQVWKSFIRRINKEKPVKGFLLADSSLVWAHCSDENIFHKDILAASQQEQHHEPVASFGIYRFEPSPIEIYAYSDHSSEAVGTIGRYMQRNIHYRTKDVTLTLGFGKKMYEGKLQDFEK